MSMLTGCAIRLRRGRVHDPMSERDTLSSWSAASRQHLDHILFAPATAEEFPDVDVEALSQMGTLYGPLGMDVRADDRIEVDGAVWEVVGRRANWPGATTSGSTVRLRLVQEV